MSPTEDILVLQNLLLEHINENELNQLINNSLDQLQYNVIKQLLKLKYDLIVQNQQEPIHFPVTSLLDSSEFLKSSHLAEILKYGLLMQNDDTELLLFESYIGNLHTNIRCSDVALDRIIVICNLLNVALELMENNFEINIDNSENLCEFYEALCDNSQQLMSHIKVITKKLVNKISKNNRLMCFDVILSSGSTEVLCCVIEYFLQFDSYSVICSLLIKHESFEKISTLISSDRTIHQRQGAFLLRLIKEYITKNKFYSTGAANYFKSPAFKKKDVDLAWDAFFTLSSISREKQIHLVKPALTLLPHLFCLHPVWVKTVYQILFSHSQNEVVSHAVATMLNSEWFKENENFLILHECLIETLATIDYSEATIGGFDALGKFAKFCNEEMFWIILEMSCEVVWNPINMWLFCKNILKKKYLERIRVVEISKYILRLQKLPHKFIRSGCIKLCLKFIDIQFDYIGTVSIKELLQLAMAVSRTDVSLDCFCDILQCPIFRMKSELEDRIRNLENVTLDHLQIIIHFIKAFDHPAELLRQVKFENLKGTHIVKIINNFEETIEDLNSEIIFASLEMIVFDCPDDLLHDAKGFIQTLSSCTAFRQLYKEQMSNFCSSSKSHLDITRNPMYTQLEIAFEILKQFDMEIANHLRDPCEFLSVDHFTPGALQVFFKNASENSIKTSLIDYIYEVASDKVVMATIEYLPILFANTKNKVAIQIVLESTLNYILKLGRGEQFKNTLKVYLKIFITVPTLQTMISHKCCEIIESIWKLSDKCSFISHLLSAHLKELVECCPEGALKYKRIFIECLLSDACIRKEELSEYNVCKDIFESVDATDDNHYVSDQTLSRFSVFESILQLINNEQLSYQVRTEFSDELACILIEKYRVYINKRYFKDSMIHIQKLRIVQALLLLQPYFLTSKDEVKNFFLESINSEGHQHCVKQLMEWLLVRLLDENEESLKVFTDLLKNTVVSNKKIFMFTTSISILFHTALISPKEDRLLNIIDLLLPWTMGANFKLRVYAQVAILNLFETALQYNFKTITSKHKKVHECIESMVFKGPYSFRSALQTYAVMFSSFDPIEDYSLETILTHIPKINNVTSTEWEGYMHVFKSKSFDSIKVLNPSKDFDEYFKAREANDSKVQESEVSENVDIIQRKITPWTDISHNKEQVKQLTNLVVVAVFVDKAANIGGLSRTCEIFGVQQLVLHDAKIINDKEYKSLSMCSDGWLNITQVQQKDIKDYLIKMKSEGYNLVAVEQTSNSVKLHNHTFQEKTVLILGNEKEGISPNVLPLADICVEIPQVGVTRSLNVHVAASLFIWEYSKTVLFK